MRILTSKPEGISIDELTEEGLAGKVVVLVLSEERSGIKEHRVHVLKRQLDGDWHFESFYGTYNFWGQSPDSIDLIESVSNDGELFIYDNELEMLRDITARLC